MEYRELVELYEKFKHRGFHVLAFPSPEFGNQEFQERESISDFVAERGVDFQMMAPCTVNGPDASPVFQHLKGISRGAAFAPLGRASGDITWNFSRYVHILPYYMYSTLIITSLDYYLGSTAVVIRRYFFQKTVH